MGLRVIGIFIAITSGDTLALHLHEPVLEGKETATRVPGVGPARTNIDANHDREDRPLLEEASEGAGARHVPLAVVLRALAVASAQGETIDP